MKPDFSGEYVLDRAACILSQGADAMRSAVVRIEHNDPAFRYKGTFASEDAAREIAFEMLSDGRDVTGVDEGAPSVSSLTWDGDALVVAWRTTFPNGDMAITFRYELVDGGRRLRAVERLRAPGHEQDNVWMFERR